MTAKAILKQITRCAESGRKSLRISGRGLTEIPEEVFELTHLTTLEMFNNGIATIPREISKLKALKHLDLSSNDISELPVALFELVELQTLELPANPIMSIPDGIGRLQKLVHLSVGGGQLASISASIGGLKSLETLRLGFSGSELPSELGNLSNLQRLSLSTSIPIDFPTWILRLQNLKRLNLMNCGLREIPEGISTLTSLTDLLLSNNDLRALPDSMFTMDWLQTISLKNNPELPKYWFPRTLFPNRRHVGQDPAPKKSEDVEKRPVLQFREDRGFIKTTSGSVGPFVQSEDGLLLTDFEIPSSTKVKKHFPLTHSDGRWIALSTQAFGVPWEDSTSILEISSDLREWTSHDFGPLLKDWRALSLNGAAISGDTVVAIGNRSSHLHQEQTVVVRGEIGGSLRIAKAPVAGFSRVFSTPTGFIALAHRRRGGKHMSIHHSPNGASWKEVGRLNEWAEIKQVGSNLVSVTKPLMVSTDWGATWEPVQLDNISSSALLKEHVTSPAGFAIKVFDKESPGPARSMWFTSNGVNYRQLPIDFTPLKSARVRLQAVADTYILVSILAKGADAFEVRKIPIDEIQ